MTASPFRSKVPRARPSTAMLAPKKNSPMHSTLEDAQASVDFGLSVIKSSREEDFASNESSAAGTLGSLMNCVRACIAMKNCSGVLDIIRFVQKGNCNDAWLLAASEEVLPKLPAIITEDLASGLHLMEEDSTKIISHLFELGLDYVDVDSESTVNHLSNLGALACLTLFNSRSPSAVDGSSIEKDYIFDCLFRQACFLLCNIVEAFPQTINALYSSLNNRTFELVRLSCDAPESSIRRSVVRLASILAAKYPDLRTAMDQFLSESFNQSDILSGLFRAIDPSQEDDFGERVDQFREKVSNMQDDNDCFVMKACTVEVSNDTTKSNDCYEPCRIDWDNNSFALYVEGMDPIRIPWYNVCVTCCNYGNKSILIETKLPSMKSIRMEFKSCTEISMRRVTHRLRYRIVTGKSMDIDLSVKRKLSQSGDPQSLPAAKTGRSNIGATGGGTIFSQLSRDGTLLQNISHDQGDTVGVENQGKAASAAFDAALLETQVPTRDGPSVSTPAVAGHIPGTNRKNIKLHQPAETIAIEKEVEHTPTSAVMGEKEISIAGPSVPSTRPTHTRPIRVSNLTQSRIDEEAWDVNMRQDSDEPVPLTPKCTGSEKRFQKLYSRSFPAIDPKFLGNLSSLGGDGLDSNYGLDISRPAYVNAAKKKGIDDTDDDMGGRKTGASNRRGGQKKFGSLKSPAQLFSLCIPENEGESSRGIEGSMEVDGVTEPARFSILQDVVGRGNQREVALSEEENGELFSKLIALVNSTVRNRNRQTRLLIDKSRARMEETRDEAKKAKTELQNELKDVLKAEYTAERTKYAKYGHELKAAVRQRLKAVGGVAKKVATRQKEGFKLTRNAVEEEARAKMTGHLTELGTKLRTRYETNVLVRRRSAQQANSLMRGISSLMMTNTEE